MPGDPREVRFDLAIGAVLGGGLACGALHEIAPAGPTGFAAAGGFAFALAALACAQRAQVVWIGTDYAVSEGGGPYGPGLDLFGLPAAKLVALRVPKPADVLWAMEEALRCRAVGCVIAELTGEGKAADLTATRRLSLAAREGVSAQVSGFGLLIRHGATALPSAAATRWSVAPAPSRPDDHGGLGRARFDLSLRKNRRGPTGRWIIEWDHHERIFLPSLPLAVAEAAVDRSDRAQFVQAG
jgi:protein ImuA